MSTLSDQIAAQHAAAEVKPKRKRKTKAKAKRDEHGRFIKAEDTADLDTPSF